VITLLNCIQSILLATQICILIYIIAGWFDDPDFENEWAKLIFETGDYFIRPFHGISQWVGLSPKFTVLLLTFLIWFLSTIVRSLVEVN